MKITSPNVNNHVWVQEQSVFVVSCVTNFGEHLQMYVNGTEDILIKESPRGRTVGEHRSGCYVTSYRPLLLPSSTQLSLRQVTPVSPLEIKGHLLITSHRSTSSRATTLLAPHGTENCVQHVGGCVLWTPQELNCTE